MTRPLLVVLLLAALVLPMGICVLVAASGLLAAMQDEAGAAVLVRIAQAGGLLWALTLIVLLISLGVKSIAPPPPPRRDKPNSDDAS